MKTIYVHIGTPKTATTYLQHYFAHNRAKLLDDGVYYLTDQRGLNAEGIAVALGFWETHDETTHVEDLTWFRQELRAAMASSARRIVISSEVFCETNGNRLSLLRRLHAELEACDADRIVIVCYLRRQDQFVESRVAFDIARWGVSTPVGNADPDAMVEYADYYKLLSDYRTVFGGDIVARPFEKRQLLNGNILDDFLDVIRVSPGPGHTLPPDGAHNSRVRGDLLEMIRLYNGSALGAGRDYAYIVEQLLPGLFTSEQLSETPGKRFLSLGPAERNRILKRYLAGNRKVAIEYLGRKDGKLFLEPVASEVPDEERPPKLDIDEVTPLVMHMIIGLFAKFAPHRTRIDALESRSIALQSQGAKHEGWLHSLEARQRAFETRLNDLEGCLSALRSSEATRADAAEARASEVESRLHEANERVTRLEQQHRVLQMTVACQSLSKKKLIGWGTGAAFRADFFRTPISLAYVIDNDAKKWGRKLQGLSIEDPGRLQKEDPRNTVVVVYSAFYEAIAAQIAQYGQFTVLPSDVVGRYATTDVIAAEQTKTRRGRTRGNLALA